MTRRLVAAAVVLASGAVIGGTATSPASAVTDAFAFVGTENVNPGLGDPILAAPSAGTWSLDLSVGVGVTTSGAALVAGSIGSGTLGAGPMQQAAGAPFIALAHVLEPMTADGGSCRSATATRFTLVGVGFIL